MATSEELEYYSSPGPMTALANVELPSSLPSEPTDVASLVQGLMIHPAWAIVYDVELPPERHAELQIRSSFDMLTKVRELDARPITEARDGNHKLVGNCRDFATLTTALLRRAGTPARARCGFAGYFQPDKWVDHWVVQHWDGERWVMLDPQIDALQQEITGLADPANLTMDQFLPAGLAWTRCQAGELDGDSFGIFDMWGQWFIESNIARDLASLNKVEMLPWDGWGAFEDNTNEAVAQAKWIDELAALTMSGDHRAITARYTGDAEVQVPATVSSFVDGQVIAVDVPELSKGR